MADSGLDVIYRILTDLSGLKQGVQDVTKHTEQIDKEMQSMLSGVKKIGSALGIAFSVGAVVQFGKSILNDADALTKLRATTGISAEGLQRLRAAGDDAGNTLEEITTAIVQMEKRLSGDDKSAIAAFQKLGLNWQQLKADTPENQFIAISDALRQIENPQDRVNIAMALFGKNGAVILPTLTRGFDDLKGAIVGMSEETVDSLDTAGDKITEWWRKTKGVIAESIVYLVTLPNRIGFAAAAEQEKKELGKFFADVKAMIDRTTKSGTPGVPSLLTIPVPSQAAQDALKKAADDHLKAVIAADKHAEEVKKVDYEYRQLGNWIAEENLKHLGAQIQEAEKNTADFYALLRQGGTQLELYGTEYPQMFMRLANGARQVLEPTRTWRDTLHEVSFAIGNVGDRWTSVAQGMIQQLEGIVQLWQAGFKTQAIGQAIGAIGQFIPASDNAATSAAKFASQGAAIGSVFGPIGLGIGAAAGAVYGWIKAGQDAKKANNLRDAFQATFGSLEKMDAALHKVGMTAKEVLNARSVREFQAAVDEFNRRLDVQKQAYEDLMDAAKRYGFTTEQLGPILAKQQLSEQLQQIYKDWQLLTAAQIDSQLVAEKMAPAINELLHTYQRMGLEVPAELKPIIQKLIDMGLLVDENGDKITDLKDIKFSETMSQGFDRVALAIKEMTDLLKDFLGITKEAANEVRNFPTFPDVQVPGVPPPGGPAPDVPMPPDMAGFAVRARVSGDPRVDHLIIHLPDMIDRAVTHALAVAG